MASQPVCGNFPAAEGPAIGRMVEWFVSAAGIVGGVVTVVQKGGAIASGLEAFLGGLGTVAGVSLGAVAVPFAGALAGAAIGLAIVAAKVQDRLSAKPGQVRCYAGVVNGIARAFSSAGDYFIPYNAQHDRVDVVVKPVYWGLMDRPAKYAYCATDMRTSALIRSYFNSPQVRNAAVGSAVGAGVGAAAGIVAGVLAGMAVGAAFGGAACSLSLWFYLVCLVLVVLVAAVVALVVTLVGASAGGAIAAGATGGGTTGPAAPGAAGPTAIAVGNYITLNATLAISGEDNDAWVGWWVDESTSPPVLHGLSMIGEGSGGGAPFNFVDARDSFVDACPAAA